jgi:non-ribosomal peptide synthetase component F
MELVFNHRLALISGEAAERWLGHYQELIQSALTDPHTDVSRLRMATEYTAEAVAVPAPGDERTLVAWFESAAELHAGRVALSCGEKSLTYAELNEQSNRLAHHLIVQGVKPQDLVAICLERTTDLVVGILAILKSGGAYLPVDLSYPKDRLAFIVADSGADRGAPVRKAALASRQKHLDGCLGRHP